MKTVIFTICAAFLAFGCSSNADESASEIKIRTTEHLNIIIAPDLSNRVNFEVLPKPLEDIQIANIVLSNLYPTILNSNKRLENQKDKVRLDFINKGLINEYNVLTSELFLDFERFKNQRKRIDYIKGRGDRSLKEDSDAFLSEYTKIHKTAQNNNFGADIWSYFNNLDNAVIFNSIDSTTYRNTTYFNSYKNIVLLLTDGYIEAGLYGKQGCKEGNMCYYLSANRVKEFRNAFKESGEEDMKTFFEKNMYGIVPVNNPTLGDVEILALEFNDRSLDKAGNATVYPTDYEILELFWKDWMANSGVKKFKMKKAMNSENDAKKEILGFIAT